MANEQIPIKTKLKLKKFYKRCRICKSKTKLEFHHLIPNGNHSKGNIIRLCHNCHFKLHQVYDEQVRTRIKIEVTKIKQDLRKSKEHKSKHIDHNKVIEAEIKRQVQLVHDKFADLKKQIKKELNIS